MKHGKNIITEKRNYSLSFKSTSLKTLALDSIIYSHYNQAFIQRKNVTVRAYQKKHGK